MPFFSFSIVTPKNMPKTSKQKTEITLSPGVLHRVRVRIPPGSRGLLHCTVEHHLHQIAPSNEGENFHGDDESIEYREWYELSGLDTMLDVYTWNESDKYDHEIILQFGVLPKSVLLPYTVAKKVKSTFSKLIGEWSSR